MAIQDVAAHLRRALESPSGRLLQHAATLQYLLDQIPMGLVIAEAPSGRVVVFNDEAVHVLGQPSLALESDVDGIRGATHPDGSPFHADEHPLARALLGEICQDEIVTYRRGESATVELSVNAAPLWNDEDEIIGAVATFANVSVVRAEAEQLRWTLERLVEARTRDLSQRNIEIGRVNAELSALTNDLERIVQERTAQLAHQAQHDHLTGLPNRILLEERLGRAVAAAKRQGGGLAVLFLDLDGFKLVNDSLGHNAGDDVLRQVGVRLAAGLRDTDVLARLAGDEFVIVLTDLQRPEAARDVAATLLELLAQPCLVDDHEVRLAASIGISLFPQDATDAATLQQHADMAMYRAKESGRNQVAFYGTVA